MTDNTSRKLYRQQLYLNAAQSVADRLYIISDSYINHHQLNADIQHAAASPCGANYSIADIYGAYFNRLCNALISKLYSEHTVYCIMSPYHHKNIICQMIIPCCNSIFTNNFCSNSCKDNKLYTQQIQQKYIKYLHICCELIKKSEKIQQKPP